MRGLLIVKAKFILILKRVILLKKSGINSPLAKIHHKKVKEGIITYPVHIRILTERENMIKFLSNVEYRYNIKGDKTVKRSLAALRTK